LTCVPAFADIEIDGHSRTAIRLLVECRPRKADVPVSDGCDRAPVTVAGADPG